MDECLARAREEADATMRVIYLSEATEHAPLVAPGDAPRVLRCLAEVGRAGGCEAVYGQALAAMTALHILQDLPRCRPTLFVEHVNELLSVLAAGGGGGGGGRLRGRRCSSSSSRGRGGWRWPGGG
eukprot:Rhum_TRINITY_DN14529_c10_g1::Rhum_TRINITY_DN14529_c10_g1_i1::g.96874::m.96874